MVKFEWKMCGKVWIEWKCVGNNRSCVEICWQIFDWKKNNLELEKGEIYEVDII